jgi:hypothetical protein
MADDLAGMLITLVPYPNTQTADLVLSHEGEPVLLMRLSAEQTLELGKVVARALGVLKQGVRKQRVLRTLVEDDTIHSVN